MSATRPKKGAALSRFDRSGASEIQSVLTPFSLPLLSLRPLAHTLHFNVREAAAACLAPYPYRAEEGLTQHSSSLLCSRRQFA